LFLTLSSPIIGYSIDAYSNFPESEEAGLTFLVERGSLEGKTLASTNVPQLALYDQPILVETILLKLSYRRAWDIGEVRPDLVALRNTGYYYNAMRFELSFENALYHQYLADVESAGYGKVYSSSTFNVYYGGG
jgi:hypothetical protein